MLGYARDFTKFEIRTLSDDTVFECADGSPRDSCGVTPCDNGVMGTRPYRNVAISQNSPH